MEDLSEGGKGEPGDFELPSSVLSIQLKVKTRQADTQGIKNNWIKLLLPPECDFQAEPSHQDYFVALARVINFGERWEDPDIANMHLEHIEHCEACLFFIAILTQIHIEPITSHLEKTHLALMPDYLSRLQKDDDKRFAAIRESRKKLYPNLDEAQRSRAIQLMEFQFMLFYRRAFDVIEKDPLHRKLFQLRRRVYGFQSSEEFSRFMEKISLRDLAGTASMVERDIFISCSPNFKPDILGVKRIFEALWLGERIAEVTTEMPNLLDHLLQCQKCLKLMSFPPRLFVALRLGEMWGTDDLRRQSTTTRVPEKPPLLNGIFIAEPVIIDTEVMARAMLNPADPARDILRAIPDAVRENLERFLRNRVTGKA